MNRINTIIWRLAVLALFVSLVPLGVYVLEKHDRIDTDHMLDVSVSIRTMSHVTVDKFGDSVWEINNGSGFIVSKRHCEVWTNQHVIADAALIEVYPRGWDRGTGIKATVVNATPRSDIAILRLDHCDGLPQAVLGNSARLKPGDETFAVGNPLGRNPDSISRGIISHTERYREGATPYLQTDAAINLGNSGGALFDRDGKVIGINTAIESTRFGSNLGVGYALPIDLVMQVVADLRKGPPSWGDAGISEIVANLSPDEAEVFQVPAGKAALVVTRAPEQGPSVGRLQAHDVIYRIDESDIVDSEQAIRLIGQHDVGDLLALDLIRAGEQHRVEVELGEGWQAAATPQADEYDGYLGMTLEMWDDAEDDRAMFKRPVITKVHSLGPAHKARIASSQKSIYINGPYVVPYILDVKTVTGVVYQGTYHAVDHVDEIEKFADTAYQSGQPLLLEIELWARTNPRDKSASLELDSTEFFKLLPRRAMAAAPDPFGLPGTGDDLSRPPFMMTRTRDRI